MKSNTYEAIHQWLLVYFGKADRCEFCHKFNKKKYEYALKKGCKHERKRENYFQLCTSCHRLYDYKQETKDKISKTLKESMTNEKRLRMSIANKGKKRSIEHIEKIRQSKLGEKNPAKRPEVKEKIRQTIIKLHKQGVYKKSYCK